MIWLRVQCPFCSSPVGEQCRDSRRASGHTAPHNDRLVLAIAEAAVDYDEAFALSDGIVLNHKLFSRAPYEKYAQDFV